MVVKSSFFGVTGAGAASAVAAWATTAARRVTGRASDGVRAAKADDRDDTDRRAAMGRDDAATAEVRRTEVIFDGWWVGEVARLTKSWRLKLMYILMIRSVNRSSKKKLIL